MSERTKAVISRIAMLGMFVLLFGGCILLSTGVEPIWPTHLWPN